MFVEAGGKLPPKVIDAADDAVNLIGRVAETAGWTDRWGSEGGRCGGGLRRRRRRRPTSCRRLPAVDAPSWRRSLQSAEEARNSLQPTGHCSPTCDPTSGMWPDVGGGPDVQVWPEPSPEPSPDGSFESTGGWEAPPGDSDGWPEPSPTPHKDRVDWDPPTRVPFSLTPAPSRICLVTSHFALPLDDGGDPTKLNQAFVDSLTTPVLDRKYRHYDENGEAMRSQLKQLLMQQQMMLHSLQETSTPPTVGDFDRAMRLLRRTTHYKVAKGLRERAATDAPAGGASGKSKRLRLKGGWPIDPIADARTAQRAKDALDGASILFQAARHYMMIEAAIAQPPQRADALGGVVLYDGVTEENHCAHLVQRLKAQAAVALRRNGQPHDNIEGRIASLKCLDNPGGQPSYWEMFNTSSHSSLIESEVVVMGNGDGATDATVGQLASIEEGVAVMLSVTGFGDDSVLTQWETDQLLRQPSPQRVFEALIGPYDDVCHPKPKSRCLRTFEQRKQHARETFAEGHPGEWRYSAGPSRCSRGMGTPSAARCPSSSKVLPGIRMNLPGAENRAAMALYLALGRDALMYNRTLPTRAATSTGSTTIARAPRRCTTQPIRRRSPRTSGARCSATPRSRRRRRSPSPWGWRSASTTRTTSSSSCTTSSCRSRAAAPRSPTASTRASPTTASSPTRSPSFRARSSTGSSGRPTRRRRPRRRPSRRSTSRRRRPSTTLSGRNCSSGRRRRRRLHQSANYGRNRRSHRGTRRRRRSRSGQTRHHLHRRRRARRRARRRRPSRRTRRRCRRRPIGSGATSRRHRRQSRPPRRRRRRRRPRRRRRRRSRRRPRRPRPTRALPNAVTVSPVNRCFRSRAAQPAARQGDVRPPHVCDGCCKPELLAATLAAAALVAAARLVLRHLRARARVDG